jgi:hypothetical protein
MVEAVTRPVEARTITFAHDFAPKPDIIRKWNVNKISPNEANVSVTCDTSSIASGTLSISAVLLASMPANALQQATTLAGAPTAKETLKIGLVEAKRGIRLVYAGDADVTAAGVRLMVVDNHDSVLDVQDVAQEIALRRPGNEQMAESDCSLWEAHFNEESPSQVKLRVNYKVSEAAKAAYKSFHIIAKAIDDAGKPIEKVLGKNTSSVTPVIRGEAKVLLKYLGSPSISTKKIRIQLYGRDENKKSTILAQTTPRPTSWGSR